MAVNRHRAMLAARWIARILGVGAGFIWLAFVIGEGMDTRDPAQAFFVVMVVLTLAAALSAWRDEGVGGAATLAGGIVLGTLAYVMAGSNQAAVAVMAGLPFIISGLLFLWGWISHRVP